jgi:hypothetical protein
VFRIPHRLGTAGNGGARNKQRDGLLGGGETFKRQGLVEGSKVTGDTPLKGILGPHPLLLLPSCYEVSCFAKTTYSPP